MTRVFLTQTPVSASLAEHFRQELRTKGYTLPVYPPREAVSASVQTERAILGSAAVVLSLGERRGLCRVGSTSYRDRPAFSETTLSPLAGHNPTSRSHRHTSHTFRATPHCSNHCCPGQPAWLSSLPNT